MDSGDALARVTRTFQALTSQIFRCPGLEAPPSDADDVGLHDLAYWLLFLSLLAGWFLFVFAPERERLEALDGRKQVLTQHLTAETRELGRLRRGIHNLHQNDRYAWERAARERMGWVAPGEITDIRAWRPPLRVSRSSAPRLNEPAQSLLGPALTAPEIPRLPSQPLRPPSRRSTPAPRPTIRPASATTERR